MFKENVVYEATARSINEEKNILAQLEDHSKADSIITSDLKTLITIAKPNKRFILNKRNYFFSNSPLFRQLYFKT